jgi:hypothetical protein
MKKLALFTVLAVLFLAVVPLSAAGGTTLTTTMTGGQEAPGPGDPDGFGPATIILDRRHGQICFRLEAHLIAPATAAHIHSAPAGEPGPVVVPLTPPTNGVSEGCVAVDRDLIRAIKNHPELYYVNVHNAEFPAGAIRGQLG